MPITHTAPRLPRDVPLPDPGLAAWLRFYWVVAAGGGILMALEILSSRVLAPHFGSSVYVWGSIISVFLAALSLGYVWGGRLADREPTLAGLGRQVTWAALAQALLLLVASPLAEWLGRWTGGSAWGTLVAATVLFGPPSVVLGTISPYAVRLAADDLARLGNTAGRLYALSTAGSLVGTLGCTFGLVPFLGLHQALALLLGLTALTALAALAGAMRREPLPALLALVLLALALYGGATPRAAAPGLLVERMTPYQTLRVRDNGGLRRLESDRVLHGVMRLADGYTALSYPRAAAAALLLEPEIDSMLVLGMGPGHAGGYLQRYLPGLSVDYVDVDPAVPEVAARYFGFEAGPKRRVHIADGRRFLQTTEERWDFIYCDTYIGLSVPFHLTTREFLVEVRRHLAPGGVFGLNLAGHLDHPFPRAIYRTVLAELDRVYAFRVPRSGNLLVLATDTGPLLSPDQLAARARQLDRDYGFELSLGELVRHQLRGELDLTDTPVLTDRFAPVDRLLHLGAEEAEGLPAVER